MTTLGPKRVAAAFTLLAALAAHADDHASKALEIEGPATVVDGNHITIKDQLIRLAGMQAPSNKWCEGCGDRAKEGAGGVRKGHQCLVSAGRHPGDTPGGGRRSSLRTARHEKGVNRSLPQRGSASDQ